MLFGVSPVKRSGATNRTINTDQFIIVYRGLFTFAPTLLLNGRGAYKLNVPIMYSWILITISTVNIDYKHLGAFAPNVLVLCG